VRILDLIVWIVVICLICSAIVFGIGVWRYLQTIDERIDELDGDVRFGEIEALRTAGLLYQREHDLTLLDVHEGEPVEGEPRIIVAEWTRPDTRDERIPRW
jgi:hypothetical protein